MTLYDLLTASRDVKAVSLLWIRETYLKESVRLGGRVAELVYKGSVLDVGRSFVGPINWAVEFSIYEDCWDSMGSKLKEADGTLSGVHMARLSPEDGPDEAEDLHDYNPNALYNLELFRVMSGDSVIWGAGC